MSQHPYSLLEIDSAQSKQPLNRNVSASGSKNWSNKSKCLLLLLSIIIFGLGVGLGVIIGRITAQCHCNCVISVSSTLSTTSPPTTTPTTLPTSFPTVSPSNTPNSVPTSSPITSPTSSPISLTKHSEIQLAESILATLGLDNFTYLFNHQHDVFYDYSLDDSQTFGGKLTSTPKGWVKFALNTEIKKINGSQVNISDWCRGYHGTELETIPKIFASNLTLLKVGDIIPGTNETLQPRPGHITHSFDRYNHYTNEEELFDPAQVFLSPSIRYSENIIYTSEQILNVSGEQIAYKVVLEAAIKTGFDIGQSTTPPYKCFDGVILNNQIEWYTKRNLEDIVLTGLLVKTRKIDTWITNSFGHIHFNSSENIIRRTGVNRNKLYSASLESVSSGYHEWLFWIKNLNETNRDGMIFGLYSQETRAHYYFKASGIKTYTVDHAGFTNDGYVLYVNWKVRMIVDFYKYEVRFMIQGYDFDQTFKLPEREIVYNPTVWLANEGDEIQLM